MSEERCLARLEDLTMENELLYKALEEIRDSICKILNGKVENLPDARKIKEIVEEIL